MYRKVLDGVFHSQRSIIASYRYRNAMRISSTSSSVNLIQLQIVRHLHKTLVRYTPVERSKVEETLRMLRDDLQHQESEQQAATKGILARKNEVKPSLMRRVGNELKHYYHGFRLLALETRLSAKYLWRLATGHSLMRKERRQLVRTVSDLFRLVPFSIFIVVPFLEFTLPIFLKLFPNMLPSTFQEQSKEREKLKRRLKVKVEMAKFLQDTIAEIGLQRKAEAKDSSNKGEIKDSKALEFAEFIKKVRSEGGYVSNAELFKFSKLFEDELTLDNLSMSTLRALCRMLDIQPLGTPEILRFQLNMKLRELKADDKEIALEGGVDNLSISELQTACRVRGMRSLGMSEQRLKDQLKQWLELSLNDKVPPSLLLLSRTIYLPEDITFTDRLKALLSSLPEGIAEQTRQKLTELEGDKVDYKARLNLIKAIEKGIQEERKSVAEAKKVAKEKKKLKEEMEKAKLAEQIKAAAGTQEPPIVAKTQKDIAGAAAAAAIPPVKETLVTAEKLISEAAAATSAATTASSSSSRPSDAAKLAAPEAAAVDRKALKKIEDAIHGSVESEAKHDVTELKEKLSEMKEDLIEVDVLKNDLEESKGSKRLRQSLDGILNKVETLVDKLEEKRRNIDETLADPAIQDAVDTKKVTLMRVDDIIKKLRSLVKVPDDQKTMEKVVRALDEDTDGIIDANIVLRTIELLSQHKDLKISAEQIKGIVEVLKKEEEMDALDEFIQGVTPYPPSSSSSKSSSSASEPSVSQPKSSESAKTMSKAPIPPPEIPVGTAIPPIPPSTQTKSNSFKETSV